MSWPSKNVAPGGVFQPAKVNYSPETRDYLQNLIRETNMSTEQRNKINYSLRSGTPLPALDNNKKKKSSKDEITIRPGSSKRRSFQTIVESGAYDRDRFTPQHPRVDRDVVKQEFQDVMAHGKVVVPKPPKIQVKKKIQDEKEPINRFEELKREIEEREEWLQDMEKLGEGEKHRWLINQQIQQRVREMELLRVKD